MGLDAEKVLATAQGDDNKARLKSETADATARGIFGAPSFFTPDGEMFWGNDRLEQALDWARRGASDGPLGRSATGSGANTA
jgi:2-hydroxychromene-2-carboxylate isomerase